jgi:hypothetical protein
MRKIIVSSNCQTSGIALALQNIFWEDEVLAIPYPHQTDEYLFETCSSCNILVTSGRFDLFQKLPGTVKVIKLPELYFSAFHPDLIYVQKKSTGEYFAPHYNSAICVWAYMNGLSVENTMHLFALDVYNELGYFLNFQTDVQELTRRFVECDLDIRLFLPFLLRKNSSFMYSVNHAKADTLVRLAKIIALKINPDHSFMNKSIDISDGLTSTFWPVYPEIAEFYALPEGSFDWQFDFHRIYGLKNYITHTFEHYRIQNISPNDIGFPRDIVLYNHVLGSKSGVDHD